MEEPSPLVATPEDRLVMEEASLALALGLDSEADAKTARRLLQLHVGALQGESRGSQEVGLISYPDSYYLILDMNGLR